MTTRASACFLALLLSSVSSAAYAQATIPTPGTGSTVDDNGVDLVSGALQVVDEGVSVGAPAEGGLAHSRTWLGSAWTHGFVMSIKTTATTATVSIGAKSITFTLSGSTYVPDARNGTTLTATASAYTFTMSDGTVVTFDRNLVANNASYLGSVNGVATQLAIPNGERVNLTYKRTSYVSGGSTLWALRLQSVTSNLGYQLKYRYANDTLSVSTVNDWTRLSRVMALNNGTDYCDPAADSCSTLTQGWPEVVYTRTASGSNTVETVTAPNGATRSYTTDTAGRIISLQSGEPGRSGISVAYDGSGRVSEVQRGNGPSWTYNWSVAGSALTGTMTGPSGSNAFMEVISDTTKNVVLSRRDALDKTVSFTHDSYGRLTRITQPEGNYTQYTYDDRGNVTQTNVVAKAGMLLGPTNVSALSRSASYPSTCTNVVTCNKPTQTSDFSGYTTNYTYNSTTGQVLTATGPVVSGAGGVAPQVRYTYTPRQAYYKNSSGSIVASGQSVSMLTAARACRTTASCSGTADEVSTTINYGPQTAGTANNLRPVSTTASGNGLSATTAMTYDYVGNLLTVDGPLTGADDLIRYRYGADRRPFATIYPDPDGAGGKPRIASRAVFNMDGQPTTVEIGTVNGLADADYNAFVPQVKRTLTYDALGRLEREAVVSPTGTQQFSVKQYGYDILSRLSCVTERMNAASTATSLPACGTPMAIGVNGPDRFTQILYKSGTNLVAQTRRGDGFLSFNASQTVESFNYTSNGLIADVTDGNGNKTTYEYDGIDRLVTTRFPNVTKGAGSSSTTDYEQLTLDANSNVVQRRLRDGGTIAMTYDELGRMTYLSGATVPTRTFSYDLLGRITQATQPGNSYTHTFTYDGLGRLTSEAQPYGSMSYQYDIAGRRTRLTWGDGFYVTYDYDKTGNMLAVRENGATSGAGVLATFSYDNLGRRTGVTRGNGTTTTYGYDTVSRLTSLSEDLAGTSYDVARTLTYAQSNQIASITSNSNAYDWSGYSAVNRPYTVNGRNQYTVAGSTSYGYDGRGNLTTAGTQTFGYNGFNQMTTAPLSVGLTYDALDRLAQVTGGSSGFATRRFVHDGGQIVSELDGSSTLVRRYVPGAGADEQIAWYEGAGTANRQWSHTDERGSIVATSNGSGAVTNVTSYDEFGIPAFSSSANAGLFQYTGQAWIPQIGMYYYKARMYSPILGRFMQADPIGYGDGLNLYAYVKADPINGRDPSGNVIEVIGNPGPNIFDSFFFNSFIFNNYSNFYSGYGTGSISIGDIAGGNPASGEIVVTAKKNKLGVADVPSLAGASVYIIGIGAAGLGYGAANLPKNKNCPAVPSGGPGAGQLNKNIQEASRQRRMNAGGSWSIFAVPALEGGTGAWFVSMVKTGGAWDYKNQGYSGGRNFGNFNYGAAAAALGYDWATTMAAAHAYSLVDTGGLEGETAQIRAGFEYASRGCK